MCQTYDEWQLVVLLGHIYPFFVLLHPFFYHYYWLNMDEIEVVVVVVLDQHLIG